MSAGEMARKDAEEIQEPATKIWSCKIGEVPPSKLPRGSDMPMREAVARAYQEITGEEPSFIFSGWGAELTEPERAVVENRLPNYTGEQPNLGLATTRQLLEELQARAEVHGYADYRTVDGD